LSAITPTAFLLCGPSLAGKSTFVATLRSFLAASVISADAINEERGLPFGGEGLPESVWAETLQIQLDRLHLAAAQGLHVIIDDTLCYRWLRERFRNEARASGLLTRLLLLRPTEEELLARRVRLLELWHRPVLSVDRLQDHLRRFEWPAADEEPIEVTSPAAQAAFIATLSAPTSNAG
jgi:predicted kinase